MRNKIIYLVLGATLAIACKQNEDKSNPKEQKKTDISFTADQMKQIEVMEVKETPFSDEFAAVGEVSFDENNVVRIYPIVSGTVEMVTVSLGDYVQRGQLLASLLSTDISVFQRDYNVAKAELEVAEKNMERAKELYSSGMLSDKDFSEAKKDYTNAKSDFEEKKQILELYGGSADRLDATFRVMAPRSGFIVERNVNEGTQIRTDNNTAIFTISDLKTVWVWANVHESDMGKVRVGDNVAVKTIAYPDKTLTGTIKKIGTMLDPESRVIRVRIELGNEDGALKPEMFATVQITSQVTEKVIAVSEKSVVLENNNYYLMRETQANTFEKIRLVIGRRSKGFVEVLEGLHSGDRIIVDGSLFALTAYNQKL